jgi:hypothetical protein
MVYGGEALAIVLSMDSNNRHQAIAVCPYEGLAWTIKSTSFTVSGH